MEIYQDERRNYDFSANQDITVKFKYKIKQKIMGFRLGFDFIDKASETIIFRTFHDDSETELQYAEVGYYESILILEKNFLKEGAYLINLAIGIHNVRWVVFDKIKFEINVSNINGINKNYSDTRPGLIMPQVSWTTKSMRND